MPNSHPNNIGRPTVMTPEVIAKLEQAFAIGCTDREATFYAGISMDSLYAYQLFNPAFSERKAALKEKPVLKARQTLVSSLDDPLHAKWYLERKRKDEFSQRLENTGPDGNPLTIQLSSEIAEKNNIVATNTSPSDDSPGQAPV